MKRSTVAWGIAGIGCAFLVLLVGGGRPRERRRVARAVPRGPARLRARRPRRRRRPRGRDPLGGPLPRDAQALPRRPERQGRRRADQLSGRRRRRLAGAQSRDRALPEGDAPARRRLDGVRRGVRRLLHGRRGRPHRREPRDDHRLDRRHHPVDQLRRPPRVGEAPRRDDQERRPQGRGQPDPPAHGRGARLLRGPDPEAPGAVRQQP